MKIGIFGGSFDPVHKGHIELAKEVIRSGAADRVVFMPAARQPFKLDRKMASGEDRINMIKLAIEDEDSFEVSDYELQRKDEISYTVNTLHAMKKLYGPDNGIALILGADTFLQIHKWTRPEEILENYTIIVGIRPGYKKEEMDRQEVFLKERFGAEIVCIKNPSVEISSTDIRKASMSVSGENEECSEVKNYIPKKVKEYIIEKGLYN